jgi:hypothetical protein
MKGVLLFDEHCVTASWEIRVFHLEAQVSTQLFCVIKTMDCNSTKLPLRNCSVPLFEKEGLGEIFK